MTSSPTTPNFWILSDAARQARPRNVRCPAMILRLGRGQPVDRIERYFCLLRENLSNIQYRIRLSCRKISPMFRAPDKCRSDRRDKSAPPVLAHMCPARATTRSTKVPRENALRLSRFRNRAVMLGTAQLAVENLIRPRSRGLMRFSSSASLAAADRSRLVAQFLSNFIEVKTHDSTNSY